jgi:hypothetical protein
MLRTLAAALALLLVMTSPAGAYLVEVTTSVAVSDANDRHVVQDAVMSAVDDVLKEAIAFKPTLIVLTNATIVGDRVYIRLLVADKDGERTFDELNTSPDQPENVDLKI